MEQILTSVTRNVICIKKILYLFGLTNMNCEAWEVTLNKTLKLPSGEKPSHVLDNGPV